MISGLISPSSLFPPLPSAIYWAYLLNFKNCARYRVEKNGYCHVPCLEHIYGRENREALKGKQAHTKIWLRDLDF